MFADAIACLLLVLVIAFGLARPVADRLDLAPTEALVAGAGLSLIGAWIIAWAVFTTGMPLVAYWLLPVLAVAGIAASGRRTLRLLADPAARDLALGQLLVTGWCVAWLAFVRNHSGGPWTGDSIEHWERARYFLRTWPGERPFLEIYQLPARPPLANVVTAAVLRMVRPTYADYQVIMAILASLAFLPTALLAGRFGGRPAARMAVLILMVNPLFVENATYPWTKLPAAFFVLGALYFFLRVRDDGPGWAAAAILCALFLAGAALTHYSAGPYVAILAAAWVAVGFRRGWPRAFARATAGAAGAGAAVLGLWFLWSIARYGVHGTFYSNTSVTWLGRGEGSHLLMTALNLRDSLIPSIARGYRTYFFEQTSPWGALQDQVFLLYQVNLLFALGSLGWLAVLREAARCGRAAADRRFWGLFVVASIILGIAVFPVRDHYGIVHICLQSVVLLGLAFLASRWESLGRGWRLALAVSWAVDLILGICLQFAVEDFAIDRWLLRGRSLGDVSATYSVFSQENLREKVATGLVYAADLLPVPPVIVLILLGALLGLAWARARRLSSPTLRP